MRHRTVRRQREPVQRRALLDQPKKRSPVLSFALSLIVGTLVLYGQVRSHDFINYDDDEYVLNNGHIISGLNLETVQWALTSTEQANWHPVTWLSHALDCQLFGLDAGYHHLTSVLIHTLNVLLLFLLLWRVTGAAGRSFVIAGLFAWHPFNVESVAWVAERKNLLSTLFFLLAIGAYGWYARQPTLKRYLTVAGIFVLALASKPMAVTLPFALLLLDYWPLQRIDGWTQPSSTFPLPQRPASRLVFEKLPLFALAAASAAVTVWAQKTGGAVQSFQQYPFGARLSNAVHSYVIYTWKMLWPAGFALLYPHPGNSLVFWKPIAAVALLCAISAAVWTQLTTRCWLIVGWLWFLGTLVPVIGIMQVGDQAMADRYAYLPLIGLFMMAVWGAAEIFKARRMGLAIRWASAFVALSVLWLLTFRQIGYWQDSVTIWSHTLQVTGENLHSEKQLANAMIRQGEAVQALPYLLNLAKLAPDDVWTHANIGASYASQRRIKDATDEFETVVRLTDRENLNSMDRVFRSSALLNVGFANLVFRDYSKALMNFQAANQSDPTTIDRTIEAFNRSLTASPTEGDYLRLSLLLRAKGEANQASLLLHQALTSNPNYANARELLNQFDASPR